MEMVSGFLMAPFTAVPLHTVVPQARAQKQQITSLNGKVLAMSPGSSRALASSMASEGSSSSQNVPKMEPFTQSRISRLMREPSLLEKAENALAGMYAFHLTFSTCRSKFQTIRSEMIRTISNVRGVMSEHSNKFG